MVTSSSIFFFRLRLNFILFYFNYNCKIILSYLIIIVSYLLQFYPTYWKMIYELVGRKQLFPDTSNMKILQRCYGDGLVKKVRKFEKFDFKYRLYLVHCGRIVSVFKHILLTCKNFQYF